MSRQSKSRRRKPLPNGARAIMGSRKESKRSKDHFPTPPWATRALFEIVLPHIDQPSYRLRIRDAWEPACGEGHMSEVLKEYFRRVRQSDLHDYGGNQTLDFLRVTATNSVDWIITNPPFGKKTLPFVHRALDLAREGVAMFVRSQWAVEGCERYEKLFRDRPPTLMAFFTERVPLHRGKWMPDISGEKKPSTATAYCWLVWVRDANGNWRSDERVFRIPPGQRKALTRPDDRARFAAWSLPQAEAAE